MIRRNILPLWSGWSSETLVSTYKATTQLHDSEDCNMNLHRSANLKYYLTKFKFCVFHLLRRAVSENMKTFCVYFSFITKVGISTAELVLLHIPPITRATEFILLLYHWGFDGDKIHNVVLSYVSLQCILYLPVTEFICILSVNWLYKKKWSYLGSIREDLY
jgi:hypothetical protein